MLLEFMSEVNIAHPMNITLSKSSVWSTLMLSENFSQFLQRETIHIIKRQIPCINEMIIKNVIGQDFCSVGLIPSHRTKVEDIYCLFLLFLWWLPLAFFNWLLVKKIWMQIGCEETARNKFIDQDKDITCCIVDLWCEL